jgi:hypothetical protein
MAYSNIRSIVDSAWRRAGVRGDGDTPDDNDSKLGLQLVNEALDMLSLDSAFAPGKIKRTAKAKADGTIVIGNDPKRLITVFNSTFNGVDVTSTATTAGAHGLKVNDNIILQNVGTLIIAPTPALIVSIPSINQFICKSQSNLGAARNGVWKLASESDNCLIDLVIEPPGQITQCNETGENEVLIEYTEDIYYSALATGCFIDGWYYNTSFDPYPVLYTDSGTIDIIFPQPGFRNVTLDTPVTAWQTGMDMIVLYRVASKIAIGYPDAIMACNQSADTAMELYKRTRKKNRAVVSDYSAPGYGGRGYDFYSDTNRRGF